MYRVLFKDRGDDREKHLPHRRHDRWWFLLQKQKLQVLLWLQSRL